MSHIPQARDGHVFLGTHLWDGSRSMLYDIDSANSIRKLLADIPMKDMDFLFQNNAKPRFAYGDDDDNHPVLFRLDDASGEWRAGRAQTARHALPSVRLHARRQRVYAWHSENGGPYAVVLEDMATGKRTMLAQRSRWAASK